MSYTIFIANPTALIPQPGRAVNTFPSGLVRVDQTYLGLTSQATTHRATLAVGNDMPDGDSSPCIDGLKIFPEVQERRREDGFTEFIVSAYGRVNTTGSVVFNWEVFTLSAFNTTGIYKQKTKTISRVLISGTEYNFSEDVSGVTEPILIDGYSWGNFGNSWDSGVSAYSASNFGHVYEIIVTIKPYIKRSIDLSGA